MSPAYVTKIGSSVDDTSPDAFVWLEPETGAELRTKGRLYVLCEVMPQVREGAAIAREVAETVRHEYYHDLSAGVEVSLRRAARQADRRAAQRVRDHRGRFTLHLAALVVVNTELHAVRVGAAQVFLVRRARLFLPGDEPGDLADFVHRTTTRRAASLGTEPDLLPSVWRQTIEAGDTVIIASGALTEGLGAEELKTAAVTLHPHAAADHIRNRAVADHLAGSHSALFIEISGAAAAATRVVPAPELTRSSDEVRIAESIRTRVDPLARQMPRFQALMRRLAAAAGDGARRVLGVGLELMPHKVTALPGSPDTARGRIRRRQRLASIAAVLLTIASGVVGVGAFGDYGRDRAIADYAVTVAAAQSDLAAARRFLAATPRADAEARERLDGAAAKLVAGASSPVADTTRLAAIGSEIEKLRDQLSNVLVDLRAGTSRSLVTQLTATVNGVYAADGGAGRLWRLSGQPFTATGATTTGVVLERGTRGVGGPLLVAAEGEALVSVDDQRKVWKAEGNTVADITPTDAARWASLTSAAVYDGNLYILDAQSGQVWKHAESGPRLAAGTAFLASVLPANTIRAIAVDGAAWLVDQSGAIFQYRRVGVNPTATRVDFTVRWQGEPLRASAIQSVEGQRALYVLDADGRTVAQVTRDGRETARVALPPSLAPATGFVVIELARGARVITAHGSKIIATDLGR